MNDFEKFKENYLNILLEEKNLQRYDNDFFTIDKIILNEEILERSFQKIISESDDPNYFVKMPNTLVDLTKKSNNFVIDKYDILTIFPEFEEYKFPKIFISFFNFDDKQEVKKVLKSIYKFRNEKIISIFNLAFKDSQKRGMFIDLTKFNVNVGILFFNNNSYNERTIYHEWTHIFQTYIGEKFEKLIELNEKNIILKNKELKKFNLTFDIVQNFFFSKKEYVTRLDNLIYMIHQTQKLEKYKNLSDLDFFNLFKNELCKKDLNNDLVKDILSIDENFLVDIQFFIASYICLDGEIFTKLCFDIQQRI
jgi:hypothetical protein